MYPLTILLNVEGGIVQDLFCTDPDAEILLVDWDADAASPGEEGIVEVGLPNGGVARTFVSRPNPTPWDRLAGTDAEAAIEAARRQGVLPDDGN